MSASALVAYATRYGSTQEVADCLHVRCRRRAKAVAGTLREGGLEVAAFARDAQPQTDVQPRAAMHG